MLPQFYRALQTMDGDEHHVVVLVCQFYHFMDTALVIGHFHQAAEDADAVRPTIDSDLEILAQAGFSNVSPQNLGSKYKKYYLIGGSYRDPQRANERKRAIGGKEILNVEGSDLFRVVLAGSDSAKEIVDEYNKALKRGVKPADIWLLKNSK